jgi:hypothetical protein
MRWVAILCVSFLCVAIFPHADVIAEPNMSRVEGILTHGASVTILGGGFGAKPTPEPLKFDDFENGLAGQGISTTGYWSIETTANTTFDSGTQRHGNSALNIRHNPVYGTNNGVFYKDDVGWTGRVYVNFWIQIAQVNGDDQYQLKIWRLHEEHSHLARPLVACQTWWTTASGDTAWQYYYEAHNGNGGAGNVGGPLPAAGYWFNVACEYDDGTIDTEDGYIRVYASRTPPSAGPYSVLSRNLMMLVTGASDPVDCISLGYNLANGGTEAITLWDDIYLDNTWARVEMGDNADYDSCTHREIQIPSAWSDTSITVTVNQGSFMNGGTAYLFVVDADGNVNTNGHPVVIGGEEDIIAPTTSGHDPSKDATGVTPDTSIVAHVQDSGDGVDQSSIVMTVNGETVNPTISGTTGDYVVTYDPPDDFTQGQEVTVAIDAQDLHDPPNIMPQDSYVFTIAIAPDTTEPATNIAQPTSGETYSTDQNTIALGGIASDNVGVISVTWVNNQGGDATASGTTDWTASNIQLQEGDNVITVSAYDAAGNTGSDTLTVTYTPPSGTYTDEFGSATSTNHPGTLEDTYINLNTTNCASESLLNTYTWPQDQVANAIIMKWDLSAIPSSATIQDATVYLYLSNMDGDGGDELYDLTVHQIVNYDPVISACTGYTYDGTNSWTPNSQCYNNIPMAQADIASAEDTQSIDKTYGYKSWSVTNMVQSWVSNSASNFGMLVNSDPVASSNSNRYFSSTEASNADQRPKLMVTYTVGELPDSTDPTVTISAPTSGDAYSTEEDAIDLAGAASDNVAVTGVTWTNSRGGSGTASGTESWAASGISLHCGENNILTVTAQDAAGNAGTDTLTVDVKPCTPLGFDTQ